MPKSIKIGVWHERQREFTTCPSSYAADWETLRTKAGDYELRLTFEGGYNVPMPNWLVAKIDATRLDGRLYNGFGGVNYSSEQLPKNEDVKYHVQTYSYTLRDLVMQGVVSLDAGFEWLLTDRPWNHPDAPKSWDQIPGEFHR